MSAKVLQYSRESRDAEIVWQGDTHDVIRSFPKSARENLGHGLRQVQKGLLPPDSKPVPGTDHGVYELRDEDERAWYRVVYLKKIGNQVHVLHCFEKQTNAIEKKDIETIKTRLARAKLDLREAARDAKRTSGHAPRNKRKRS